MSANSRLSLPSLHDEAKNKAVLIGEWAPHPQAFFAETFASYFTFACKSVTTQDCALVGPLEMALPESTNFHVAESTTIHVLLLDERRNTV